VRPPIAADPALDTLSQFVVTTEGDAHEVAAVLLAMRGMHYVLLSGGRWNCSGCQPLFSHKSADQEVLEALKRHASRTADTEGEYVLFELSSDFVAHVIGKGNLMYLCIYLAAGLESGLACRMVE